MLSNVIWPPRRRLAPFQRADRREKHGNLLTSAGVLRRGAFVREGHESNHSWGNHMSLEYGQQDRSDLLPMENGSELISSSWRPTQGERVQVRRSGCDVRQGLIEAVMNDNSGFWLAADGVESRTFVLLGDTEQIIPIQT